MKSKCHWCVFARARVCVYAWQASRIRLFNVTLGFMPQWFVFQMKNFSALSKKVQSSGKDLLFYNFYHPCTFPMLCQRCRISHSGGRSPVFFTFLAFLLISRSSTVFSRLFRKCWVHHKIPMYVYMYTIVGLLRGMGCRRTHMYIMHAVECEDGKCYKSWVHVHLRVTCRRI